MNSVTVQLVLTLTSPNAMPIQIRKSVTIALGRNLDGSAKLPSYLYPGTNNEGELEVDLVLPPNASFEFPSLPLQAVISYVAPDGVLKTVETASRPQPMSLAYRQLTLLSEEYKSEKTTCEACGGLLEPVLHSGLSPSLAHLCRECHGERGCPF